VDDRKCALNCECDRLREADHQPVQESEFGSVRQMLVLCFGRLGSSEAEEAAVELLSDGDVNLHVIGALAKMRSNSVVRL
jgi:hypothetical protein